MLKFMLDTDTVIYTIKNRPPEVRETFKQHSGQICVSTVTLSELIYGVEKSAQPQRNLSDIEGMMARLDILEFDAAAAAHCGQIRADLAGKGRQIGLYDVMIAGHARSQGLILVSNNTNEFVRVSGLRLENWLGNF